MRPRYRRYFRHGFLPQLIAFEACLRHGSVTRAAQELALAQSTVSGLLRRLSDTVGGEPLLESRGGRMVPTPTGEAVRRLCDDMLDSLDRFESLQQGPAKASVTREPLIATIQFAS